MNKNLILVGLLVLLAGFSLFYGSKKDNTVEQNVVTSTSETVNQEDSRIATKTLGIVSNESEATYEINESLQGKPVRVVGKNKGLSGNIVLNSVTNEVMNADINLDANGFVTDIAKRDENVEGMVLKSNQPENALITFSGTAFEGFPTQIEVGVKYPVIAKGNLTISGVSKEVSLDSHVTLLADGSMSIHGKTSLKYADFGLSIPNFPFLANISETVDISVNLIAR